MRQLTKQEAVDFFAALFYGEHHIPGEVKECGSGWQISSNYTVLSTFDFSDLTRLVLLAHDRCIRAQVSARGMNRLVIMIHGRTRGSTYASKDHPTMEDQMEFIRQSKYYNYGRELELKK